MNEKDIDLMLKVITLMRATPINVESVERWIETEKDFIQQMKKDEALRGDQLGLGEIE